jgi:GH24 family phage-related lysozyme (muramidase)
MRQSVIDVWYKFSEPFEGRVYSMYVDVLNYVTTAVGCLIDPVEMALSIPWRHAATGQLATPSTVRAAWMQLKHHPGFAIRPGGPLVPLTKQHFNVAARLNDLRIDDAACDALVLHRLNLNVGILRKRFPQWDSWPADAQLATLSMAWAMGAAFYKKFGNWTRYADAQDWAGCAAACKIREGTKGQPDWNPGIIPRNKANKQLFENAEQVRKLEADPERLYWPANDVASAVAEPAPASVRDAELEFILSQIRAESWSRTQYEVSHIQHLARLQDTLEPEEDPHPTDPSQLGGVS